MDIVIIIHQIPVQNDMKFTVSAMCIHMAYNRF